MDAGVAVIGVVFGFLFILRHAAGWRALHRSLPSENPARASIILVRSTLTGIGTVMVVAFTKPLPVVSRILVSLVAVYAGLAAGWFVVPVVIRIFSAGPGSRAQRLEMTAGRRTQTGFGSKIGEKGR